jgi:hypothetical protein
VLSGHFGNVALECHLLFCSKAGISATLSGSVIAKRMDFESADLSVLSFEALDDLLLSSSVMIESEDQLLRLILNFGSGYRFLLRHIQPGFLTTEGVSLLADHFEIPPESVWECAAEVIAHPPLDSVIISDFPAIFAEFRGKRFQNLWRRGRDGFGARDFDGRCDGHANTLTVILDTDGNISGGFTPVEWDSSSGTKADDSQKSFLFTLQNPHNIAARRFGLKTEWKEHAVFSCSSCGPYFGDGHSDSGRDIAVHDQCNTDPVNFTKFGSAYTNDTGMDGNSAFTGSEEFRVKEIEVFEITD